LSEHRRQPGGARLALGIASAAQVVSHQRCVVCPHQHLGQALLQQVVEVDAIRRWRRVHAQVEDRGQFDFRRRHIGAARAAALQQVAAPGFVVGARDGRQVDLQLRRQLALRRQAVARLQRAIRHRCLQRIGNLQETRPGTHRQAWQPAWEVRILYGFQLGQFVSMYGDCFCVVCPEIGSSTIVPWQPPWCCSR